jgi:hypothetical protein
VKYYIHQPLFKGEKCKDCFSHYRVGVKRREKLLTVEGPILQCHYTHYVHGLFITISAGGIQINENRQVFSCAMRKSAANECVLLYCLFLGVPHFHTYFPRESAVLICKKRTRFKHIITQSVVAAPHTAAAEKFMALQKFPIHTRAF